MPLDALPLTAPMRAKLKEGWAKLTTAARPPQRRKATASEQETERQKTAQPAALVALALDRLAGASLHAAAYGTPSEVVVPDEATAVIFRAALVITAAHRGTDRLLRVVVQQ